DFESWIKEAVARKKYSPKDMEYIEKKIKDIKESLAGIRPLSAQSAELKTRIANTEEGEAKQKMRGELASVESALLEYHLNCKYSLDKLAEPGIDLFGKILDRTAKEAINSAETERFASSCQKKLEAIAKEEFTKNPKLSREGRINVCDSLIAIALKNGDISKQEFEAWLTQKGGAYWAKENMRYMDKYFAMAQPLDGVESKDVVKQAEIKTSHLATQMGIEFILKQIANYGFLNDIYNAK
ncbi:MAG: hypothetical protein V2A63_02075, partial [Patescibacteria group bacterium]